MRGMLAASVAWIALQTGCVSDNPLDPTGDDFSVSAQWTVNGEAPSPEACAAAGIEEFRVGFFESSRALYFPELIRCCSDGSLSTEPILAYAHYQIELQAHDLHRSGGTTAASTERTTLEAEPPTTHFDLTPDGPLDFIYNGGSSGLRVTASWTVGGKAASAEACAAAGIETVRLRAFGEADVAFADPVFERTVPCGPGRYDSKDDEENPRPLSNGARYRTETTAIDSGGGVVSQLRPETLMDASCLPRFPWPAADL